MMELRMKEREFLDFRTPQHPSMGSNNCGGASPPLARNILTESLETKYLQFHTLRMHNEIFPVEDLPMVPPLPPPPPLLSKPVPMTPKRGFLLKLGWRHEERRQRQGLGLEGEDGEGEEQVTA